MMDDLAGLRHDMEAALAAADRDNTRLEHRIEELEREDCEQNYRQLREDFNRLTATFLELQESFLKFLVDAHEPLAKAFNAHGHQVYMRSGSHEGGLTGHPVDVDGPRPNPPGEEWRHG